MDISAEITGIKYTPFLCRKLDVFNINQFEYALSRSASFILDFGEKKQIAISWWVSPKRTRSYPYTRVYDTLGFQGKKVTVIPLLKDEGKDGDRDFLQWDTISLMSLLGIFTIITYYNDAEQSLRYKHKITHQKFDTTQLKRELQKLLSYQSDALHWNLSQIDKVGNIGQKALNAYTKISNSIGVGMHSSVSARKRIQQLLKGKEIFMNLSRSLAQKAQLRESFTTQPKEKLSGNKATLTIKNYLGGYYFFTSDEAEIIKNTIYLVEGKHSKQSVLPSLEDIKDGLIKMILFANLENVKIENKKYKSVAVLKLTSNLIYQEEKLIKLKTVQLKLLKKEADVNNFQVRINETKL